MATSGRGTARTGVRSASAAAAPASFAGFSHEAIHELRRAYKMLFNGGGTLRERIDEVAEAFADQEAVQQIVGFLRQGGDRAICVPRTGKDDEG